MLGNYNILRRPFDWLRKEYTIVRIGWFIEPEGIRGIRVLVPGVVMIGDGGIGEFRVWDFDGGKWTLIGMDVDEFIERYAREL